MILEGKGSRSVNQFFFLFLRRFDLSSGIVFDMLKLSGNSVSLFQEICHKLKQVVKSSQNLWSELLSKAVRGWNLVMCSDIILFKIISFLSHNISSDLQIISSIVSAPKFLINNSWRIYMSLIKVRYDNNNALWVKWTHSTKLIAQWFFNIFRYFINSSLYTTTSQKNFLGNICSLLMENSSFLNQSVVY